MARQKPSDQIATLQKQQAELVEKLKAAKIKAAAQEREAQRRRHELVGAVVMAEYNANPTGAFAVTMKELLHTGITKAADRADFGLSQMPKPAKAAGGVDGGG